MKKKSDLNCNGCVTNMFKWYVIENKTDLTDSYRTCLELVLKSETFMYIVGLILLKWGKSTLSKNRPNF